MVVPESQDKMYHPSDDLQRDAHVPDFNSYLALYRKSLENPEGRSNTSVFFSAILAVFPHSVALHLPLSLSAWSSSVYLPCLQPLNTAITLFQLSGKRLLMSSFGKSHQQGQCFNTTLM